LRKRDKVGFLWEMIAQADIPRGKARTCLLKTDEEKKKLTICVNIFVRDANATIWTFLNSNFQDSTPKPTSPQEAQRKRLVRLTRVACDLNKHADEDYYSYTDSYE
jgi:hypothetical protein